ncbi:hypothetical protein HUJ05_010406 [Dendroctonus ponderosae]|nr:hypothetical protein HUJ05_010406 [Dendroctonus ponderosae]
MVLARSEVLLRWISCGFGIVEFRFRYFLGRRRGIHGLANSAIMVGLALEIAMLIANLKVVFPSIIVRVFGGFVEPQQIIGQNLRTCIVINIDVGIRSTHLLGAAATLEDASYWCWRNIKKKLLSTPASRPEKLTSFKTIV